MVIFHITRRINKKNGNVATSKIHTDRKYSCTTYIWKIKFDWDMIENIEGAWKIESLYKNETLEIHLFSKPRTLQECFY